MQNNFFKVGKKYIGDGKKVFIIAEIGINHGGSFSRCLKMIKAAAKSGADSVKIQTSDVNESYMINTDSYREFKNKNFSDNELLKLKRFSEKLGVEFFSTPGDIKSLMRLIKIRVKAVKISSGLATNFPLIGESIKRKIPTIISTGFSTKKDIYELKKFIMKFKHNKIAILKCTSQYPANPEHLNLNAIKFIKKTFNFPTGYSDHTIDDTASIIAVAKGAKIIEKHFTLNKNQKGADHKISLEPKEFNIMVRKIRDTEKMLGSSNINLSKEIKKKRNMFLRLLTARKEIKKGDFFTLENIGFFRHNKNNGGLEPKYFFKIKNKRSKKKIIKGKIINRGDLN